MAEIMFTVTITDVDEKLLNDQLLDIQTWLDKAIKGKTNNCWLKFKNEWTTKLMDDPTVESIPATKEGLVELVTSRTDYKTCTERVSESGII